MKNRTDFWRAPGGLDTRRTYRRAVRAYFIDAMRRYCDGFKAGPLRQRKCEHNRYLPTGSNQNFSMTVLGKQAALERARSADVIFAAVGKYSHAAWRRLGQGMYVMDPKPIHTKFKRTNAPDFYPAQPRCPRRHPRFDAAGANGSTAGGNSSVKSSLRLS